MKFLNVINVFVILAWIPVHIRGPQSISEVMMM
jgi:hypothetical protein